MEAGMSRTDGFNGDGTQGGGREERTGPKPKKKLESLQRNQEQSTPVSEWCCQELVNTKSAECAAPAWDLTQVTDDIRMWLSSLQNQFEFDH